jgi:hypothetical protein
MHGVSRELPTYECGNGARSLRIRVSRAGLLGASRALVALRAPAWPARPAYDDGHGSGNPRRPAEHRSRRQQGRCCQGMGIGRVVSANVDSWSQCCNNFGSNGC